MQGQYRGNRGVRPRVVSRSGHDDASSARLFICAGCRAQSLICSCCDRGQIYCAGGCGQLYTWRRQMLRRVPAAAPAGFARVDVVEEQVRPTVPTTTTIPARSGLIEVLLLGGASVRVDGCVDERALRPVLAALRG